MKPKQGRIFFQPRLAIILVAGLLAGCGMNRASAFQFETHAFNVFSDSDGSSSVSPQVGVSPSGALFVLGVYGNETSQRLGLKISHDAGDTFGPVVSITEPNVPIRATGEASPSLGVTSTAIYALWEQASVTGGSDLLFAREAAPGQPFQKPIRVTDKTRPSFNGFSSLAISPKGDIFAVWLDGRSMGEMHGTFSVYLARSTDRGMTFGPNVEVASGSCPCCRPRLAFGENGEIYVFWRKVFPGQIRDMVASTSNDGGASFTAPVRVSEDNWKINGCPESGPVAAVVGHRVYVAWMTATDQEHAGVKLSWSDDGGRSFAHAVQASQGVLDANHPSLSITDDSRAVLVFQGRDSRKNAGWNPLQAYLVEIDKSGKILRPIAISASPGSASYPVVATGTAGRVFVAWTASEEKTSAILLIRGRKG